MATAWFVCEYKIRPDVRPIRYCAMDDFTSTIEADGGAWSESEVLGGYAVVKVRAAAATLTSIGGTVGYYRIPSFTHLTDVLTGLTAGQRTAIQNRILAMGYTQAEIDAAMGNTLALWRQKVLSTLLRFIAQRRLSPRWDSIQQQFVLDGALRDCKPIDAVNTEVADG
jgi:uncharacterized membrane protein (UPF0136 family)